MDFSRYYGKIFELSNLEKISSMVQDKMSNSEAEQKFDESFKNREDSYLACARMVRDGLQLPPHKLNDLYNGLLLMTVNHYSPSMSLKTDDIEKNLGYIPAKLELASFMHYLNNPQPVSSGYKKIYEFKQEDINLFKKPEMIDLFKEDMRGCFDKLNTDFNNANVSRHLYTLKDTGLRDITMSHHRFVTKVEKFFQVSAMIDENYGTSLVKDFNSQITSYIKNVKGDIKNKQDNVAFGLMIDTGAHDFEKILNFSNQYEIENSSHKFSLDKNSVSKNILNMKEKLFGRNKDNTQTPTAP